MSVVYIDQEAVHYEVLGRGRPVLFLHGWLGSWRYWLPSMEITSSYFRTYAFDLIGFGDTQQRSIEPSIGAYGDQVIRFLDALGIDRITLVGHSMGGMVALKTAIEHPERIERVVTVGAPIVGSSLAMLLKLTAFQPIARGMSTFPRLTQRLFRYFLDEANEQDMLEILEDSVKSTADSVRASVRSMMRTDLRPELPRLRVPALVIHGSRDDIVMPSQIEVICCAQATAPYLRQLTIEGSRHFPWTDHPERFHPALLEFLRAPLCDLVPVDEPAPTTDEAVPAPQPTFGAASPALSLRPEVIPSVPQPALAAAEPATTVLLPDVVRSPAPDIADQTA